MAPHKPQPVMHGYLVIPSTTIKVESALKGKLCRQLVIHGMVIVFSTLIVVHSSCTVRNKS